MRKPAETNTKAPKREENSSRPARKTAGVIAKAAAAAVILPAAAASFAGGAVTAVGLDRLKEAFQFEAGGSHAETPDEGALQYVSIPETPYELLGGEKQGYLLASISLKTTHRENVESVMPEIRAVFQAYIRELSPADLKGATGLYRLRRDCLHRARKVAGAAAIEDIFITDIVVQ